MSPQCLAEEMVKLGGMQRWGTKQDARVADARGPPRGLDSEQKASEAATQPGNKIRDSQARRDHATLKYHEKEPIEPIFTISHFGAATLTLQVAVPGSILRPPPQCAGITRLYLQSTS